MSAAAAVEHVRDTVDYLRISVGEGGDREWVPCADVVQDPDALRELVRGTAAGRGTDRDDVAMSLFVQAYAFRVASLAIGAWLLDEVALDVDPTTTSIALGRHRPDAVRIERARAVGGTDPLVDLHTSLVDGHLALLVSTAHEACRVGEALLWGNLGAACASSFGAFMAPLPDRHAEIRDRAGAFLAAARPELARSGRLVHVGPLWAWERASCCLWYKTDSGFRCEDCSLWTDDERRARYERALAEDP